jgi:hypothetical protein
LKNSLKEIPRWWLEGGSRKHASQCKHLERSWRYTWQERPRRGKTLTPPHPQPVHSIPTPC